MKLLIRAPLMLLVLTVPASAQEHQHPRQDAALHEQFYAAWLMPNPGGIRTQSCCSLRDCYPTEFKLSAGQWFAKRREDGRWLLVPESKLEQNQSDPRESPDGRGHICAGPPISGNALYCATLGSGT